MSTGKLFSNSWGNSSVQFLVIISCFTFSVLHGYSQQEAEWVHINFERRDLNSPHKSHPPPDDFGEICICITFFHIVSTVAYLTMVAHQCPLSLPRPVLDIEPHQTAIFKKVCNSGICWYENGHTGIPGLWTQVLNAGLWTMDSGPWTLDSDATLWTLGSGHWTLVDCSRTETEASFWFCLIKLPWVRIYRDLMVTLVL